jgi:hypothetical protein
MDPAYADRIVLVPGVGPEILAALLLLSIGIAGIAVGILMFRRGRVEALSLTGIFGFVILGALVALLHLPTRLVFDRDGIDLTWWMVREHRGWRELSAIDVANGRLGVWVRWLEQPENASALRFLWPPRAGFFVGTSPVEPHQLVMRIEAWRLGAGR